MENVTSPPNIRQYKTHCRKRYKGNPSSGFSFIISIPLQGVWKNPAQLKYNGCCRCTVNKHSNVLNFHQTIRIISLRNTTGKASRNRNVWFHATHLSTTMFNVNNSNLHTETQSATSPKITSCPRTIKKSIKAGASDAIVSWVEPVATDDSGIVPLVSKSHATGSTFGLGSTVVKYTFGRTPMDTSSCVFTVEVKEGKV